MAASASNDASPGVEVQVLGGVKGRGLVALRNFQPGDVIFEESPLVCCQFSWNQAYGYGACDFCLKPLETAQENARRLTGKQELALPYAHCCSTRIEQHIECPRCEVTYCSQWCYERAVEQYHQSLCQGERQEAAQSLQQLQDAWRQMHYPPETANIMLVARMCATVKQAQDKEGALHLFSQFCNRTVNETEQIVHKLLGEEFRVQLEQLRDLLRKALLEECLYHWLSMDGFRSLIALVGTNGQGIGTSALNAWVRNCDALDISAEERPRLNELIDKIFKDIEQGTGSSLNNEGSGLYPLQSSCNHSCVPNAEATFPYNNSTLVMEAIQDIQPGQEILVSYLDERNRNRSRHSRIKLLRDNYLFTCTCSKCVSQAMDPDVSSEEE